MGGIEHLLGQLGLGTNANDMHVLDLLNQLIPYKRFTVRFNLDLASIKKSCYFQVLSLLLYLITLFLECLDSSLVDIFQQENFDFRCIERTKYFWLWLTERAATHSRLLLLIHLSINVIGGIVGHEGLFKEKKYNSRDQEERRRWKGF